MIYKQALMNDTTRTSHTVPARYWHKLNDGRLQCDLCPRLCKLNDGQKGVCFVRERQGEQIMLTTYGRSSGFCVDPIEKKPLNHFLPGTAILSFGTAGCNLTCKFCQNWDISKAKQDHRLTDQASPEALAQTAKALDCSSIAYTYNDPVIFLEYAVDVAKACREWGIKNVAVSAGYISPEPAVEFFSHMDAANIDLKGFTDDFYYKLCGAHLQPVLDTLKYIKHQTDTWLEMTTLLIPGENDSAKELNEMTRWVASELGADVPMHFSAFHPDWKMRDKQRTPLATLQRARRIAMQNGLRYVYTGNVVDPVGASSWCHGCGELLIERDRYTLGNWRLDSQGQCNHCGTAVSGVFTLQPGDWGSRRMPVRIVGG